MMMRTLLSAVVAVLSDPGLAGAQSSATNQRLSDTAPVLPDLYAQRMAQFEREPVKTGRVIFLGNSITQGGDWVRLVGDSTVINRGIGGDVTYGVRRRLDDVIRRRPSKLFILVGINDISRDVPDAVIADNHREIIRAVQAGSPDTRIYVQSVLPVNPDYPGFPQHYDKQEHVVRLNRLLRRVAASTHVRFLDLYPLFLDGRNRLDAKYTVDGLHLNELGYHVWVDFLRKTGSLTALRQQKRIGLFDGETDVGKVSHPGSTSYDAERQQYSVSGSGANMWFDHDDFHFVWRRMKGNFILTARARFTGKGVEPHRKLGWIVRSSLTTNSPHVTAAVHGDGLTALQFRRSARRADRRSQIARQWSGRRSA
jgi:lysophospholipase L1-like esterase